VKARAEAGAFVKKNTLLSFPGEAARAASPKSKKDALAWTLKGESQTVPSHPRQSLAFPKSRDI